MSKIEVNKIYNENHLVTLQRMPNGYLDLTVTSVPYDNMRDYDGYNFDWRALAQLLWDKTKDGGVVVWNVNDETVDGSESTTSAEQKIFFRKLGFNIHDTMIYEKLNFSSPETTRYHQVFEYVFVFSKGKPKTFNPIKDKKNLTAGEVGNKGTNTFANKDGTRSERSKNITANYGMRHNVWKGKTRGQEQMCKKLEYTAMMPNWLARDLVYSFSNAGEIVYDPCGGSGTVIIQAAKLGMQVIMSDLSERGCRLASRDLKRVLAAPKLFI